MRVLHTGTFDVNAGGPAMSSYLTLLGLRQLGVDAAMLMYPLSRGGRLRGEDVPVYYAKPPIDNKLCYSPAFKREMRRVGTYDIYHAQGVWQYPTYALAAVARGEGRPYLITPRGMLYPQDIAKRNSGFKKLSLRLRLLSDLNRASCVHVTCSDEMAHCRRLGVTSPIAIIPNPVEVKAYTERKQDTLFRIGYLGRLSPRKNVEALIYAFAAVRAVSPAAELLIIGGGDERYEQFLKSEVARLQLPNVRFTGFLSGQEKEAAIASLSLLAMPSEFENLGNVILEGLVRGIPCIATHGAPWQELQTHSCGWWMPFSQEALQEALVSAVQTPASELAAMGARGRTLMETTYSVEAVATQMKALYDWLLTKGEKPSFIYD